MDKIVMKYFKDNVYKICEDKLLSISNGIFNGSSVAVKVLKDYLTKYLNMFYTNPREKEKRIFEGGVNGGVLNRSNRGGAGPR